MLSQAQAAGGRTKAARVEAHKTKTTGGRAKAAPKPRKRALTPWQFFIKLNRAHVVGAHQAALAARGACGRCSDPCA